MTDTHGLLPATLCPERTFALVVGVEKYDVGHGWNLRGPARDALRFARWLIGQCRVPNDNVRLLLSPLSVETLDFSGTELKDRWQQATEENVKNALLAELAECDGDMLWIYWAGHGFVDRRRDTLLPYADAHEGQIRHLNLDSALNWWRTDMVKQRRFPLQAALLDACRMEPPSDGTWNFGTADYGGGSRELARHQFQLYACRVGELARNDGEREEGKFTAALLEELAGRQLAEAIGDLPGIGRSIHRRFEELKRTGDGWQLPQFVKDRGWDDCSFLDAGLPPLPKARQLDQPAWDGLGEAFGDHRLPRHTYDAYAWAFEVAGCTTPVYEGLPAETLIDIARDLDGRHGGKPDVPLTLPFVRFLSERATDAAWASGLRAWVEDTQGRLGVPPLPPPPPPSRDKAVLHLRLDPAAEEEGLYLAREWLRRNNDTRAVWESDGPLRLDEVKAVLGGQLRRTDEAFGDGQLLEIGRVEFHVPFELLETPFDEWEVPGRTARPLGLLHQVVVRCPDERRDAWAAWERKWRWVHARGGRHREAVRPVTDTEVTHTLGIELRTGDAPACVVSSGVRTQDVLDASLEGGVPVTLWWRGAGPSAGDLECVLAPNAEGTPTTNVLTLPDRVHGLRIARAREYGESRIALLWDDPDCTVATQSLRSAPTTKEVRGRQ
ncbi:caspase family protein [Streptomyces sp. NPDC050803]|uniref:VMAP-C domain-containing protein n=1 Tax=unclassified Streptomyces TaxID=2593676 RepID=UPI00341325F7